MTDSRKLLDAARAGGSLLVVMTSLVAPAQGLVRLVMRTPSPQLDPPRHLRAVTAAPEQSLTGAPEPVHSLEVVHRGAPRQLRLPHSRFPVSGFQVRARRTHSVLSPGLTKPELVRLSSLQRPKRSHERDGGAFGLSGNRPGRDCPVQLTAPAGRPEDGSGALAEPFSPRPSAPLGTGSVEGPAEPRGVALYDTRQSFDALLRRRGRR